MTTQIELYTPRLILKSITPQIINELFESKDEEEIKLYFNVEEDGYKHLKEMYEKGMETHRFSLFYFLLIDKESDNVIGECGFHTWNKPHRRAELFYSLRNDEFKRKGFMTEALMKIIDFGFKELDLHRIEALVANWNIASIKLLENYSFMKEGTMREDYVVDGRNEDSECYSLLRWEWEKKSGKNTKIIL